MRPGEFFGDGLPLTESQYLALGVTRERIELVDGGLLVNVSPSVSHQALMGDLLGALHPAAERAGLHALGTINVRLGPDRILNPDLVLLVTTGLDWKAPVVEAGRLRLVGEVVSPATAAIDRVLKMHCYAQAGIPWYLLADTSLHLYELDGGTYREHSRAVAGQTLTLTAPVSAVLEPSAWEVS